MTKMTTVSNALRQRISRTERLSVGGRFARLWLERKFLLMGFLFLGFPLLCQAELSKGNTAKDTLDLELAPGLILSVPSSLSVALHPETTGLLVGEIEGAPGYFMSASMVEHNDRDNVLWARLETELKQSGSEVKRLFKGHFTTQASVPITYRAYLYRVQDQSYRQVYYLVKAETRSYWVGLTAVETVNLKVILPFAEVLLKRAQVH